MAPTPEPPRQYKTLPLKTSAASLEDGQFTAYIAAFNSLDGQGEVIAPGAFAAALPAFLADGVICWQHDWTTPIGRPLAAHEDAYGLHITAHISQTAAGKDALTLLRDGVVSKMSIGFRVAGERAMTDAEGIAQFGKSAYEAAKEALHWSRDSIRVLTEINPLYEGSPVTVPANPKAIITGVKDLSLLAGLDHDRHFSTVLAAVEEYLVRVKDIRDLRAKSGRVLSAANAGRLATMRDSLATHLATLDDLLSSAAPPPDDDDESDDATLLVGKALTASIRHEFLRYQQSRSRQGAA